MAALSATTAGPVVMKDRNGVDLRAGDRVRYKGGVSSWHGYAGLPQGGEEATVEGPARVRFDCLRGPTFGLEGRWFDKVTTTQTQRENAMTYATALQFLPKFIALGQVARMRGRSWDDKGLYAAIDTIGPGGTVLKKLYTSAECQAELDRLDAAQPAIDVVGETYSGYLYFRVPFSATYLPAPAGVHRWTPAEVRQVGGIVRKDGKKYRLCREEVVRTVIPICEG